jgi:ketosteroid isomerase-like protein
MLFGVEGDSIILPDKGKKVPCKITFQQFCMKYLIILLIPVLFARTAGVQQISPLMQMVNSEKSFAASADSAGITEAFLKYLDDSAKVFERGQILYGRQVWGQRKMDSMELKWYPEFAEVAASGDIGYTTGPSEFRVKKGSEKPDHKGYFNSIWRKNSEGEWKVVLDMGTPSPQSEYNESHVEYADKETVHKVAEKMKKKKTGEDIKEVEKKFIADYADRKGYIKFGARTARYYRPGNKVAKGHYPYNDTLKLSYINAGTGMASTGDLGYAYGYVEVSGRTGNYLRVWKKEADTWRIVLDAATY